MFPRHDPAKQTFQFFYSLSGATETDMTADAVSLRDYVKSIGNLYGYLPIPVVNNLANADVIGGEADRASR